MSDRGPSRIIIDDPDDPRLSLYRNMKDRWLIAKTGAEDDPQRFIAEGERVVRTLFSSGFATETVLGTAERLAVLDDVLPYQPGAVEVYQVSRELMKLVTGFDVHRGLLAMGRRKPLLGVAEILAEARACVVLEDLSNHDNIGGMFRNVAALAGAGCPVLLTPGCADPMYRKAIRVSMGAALRMPWTRTGPWPGALAEIEAAGFEPIALTPGEGSIDLGDWRPSGRKPALLVGAEGPGLAEETMARCTKVRIPIDPAADSLNAMVAGAIALHRLVEPVPTGDPA